MEWYWSWCKRSRLILFNNTQINCSSRSMSMSLSSVMNGLSVSLSTSTWNSEDVLAADSTLCEARTWTTSFLDLYFVHSSVWFYTVHTVLSILFDGRDFYCYTFSMLSKQALMNFSTRFLACNRSSAFKMFNTPMSTSQLVKWTFVPEKIHVGQIVCTKYYTVEPRLTDTPE